MANFKLITKNNIVEKGWRLWHVMHIITRWKKTYVCDVVYEKHNNNMFHIVIIYMDKIFEDTHQRCEALICNAYFPSLRHDEIKQKKIQMYIY
jgi:hypothetical protein